MTMEDSVDDDWSSDDDDDRGKTMKESVSLESLERTTTGRLTTSASTTTSRTAASAACEFAARAQALVAELGRWRIACRGRCWTCAGNSRASCWITSTLIPR